MPETPPTDATTDTLEAIAAVCDECALRTSDKLPMHAASYFRAVAARIRDVAARLTPEPVKPMTNRELLASLPVGSVVRHQDYELTVTLDSIGKKYAHASETILSLSEICGCDRCGASSNDPKVGIVILSRPDAPPPVAVESTERTLPGNRWNEPERIPKPTPPGDGEPVKTLRDEFAMAAMQAELTGNNDAYPYDNTETTKITTLAKFAYHVADKLLAARTP